MKAAGAKDDGVATIANNVLMEIRRIPRERRFGTAPHQRAMFGIFGRNTASSPIAGRKAQT